MVNAHRSVCVCSDTCVCVSRIYEGHVLPGDGCGHRAGAEEGQPQPSVWWVQLNHPLTAVPGKASG